MKVTARFGEKKVVVPCSINLKVSDVTELAVERYKKALSKANGIPSSYISLCVRNLFTDRDGGILDPDDEIGDVVEDGEQLAVDFDEHICIPRTGSQRMGCASRSDGITSDDSSLSSNSRPVNRTSNNADQSPLSSTRTDFTNANYEDLPDQMETKENTDNSNMQESFQALNDVRLKYSIEFYNTDKPLGIHLLPQKTAEESGGLIIKTIEPNSRISSFKELLVDDCIICINGTDIRQFTFEKSQETFRTALKEPKTRLTIIRRNKEKALGKPARMHTHAKCIKVNLRKQEDGFGFRIATNNNVVEGQPNFIYVKQVLFGGPAFIDGRLKRGDRIVRINGVDTSSLSLTQVVSLLKQVKVNEEVELEISQEGFRRSRSCCSPKRTTVMQPVRYTFEIRLNETGSAGLGMSVKGSSRHTDDGCVDLGLYVNSVLHGGAVQKDGRIKPNDRIVMVNGICLDNVRTNEEAMNLLRDAMEIEVVRNFAVIVVERHEFLSITSSEVLDSCQNEYDELPVDARKEFHRSKIRSNSKSSNEAFCKHPYGLSASTTQLDMMQHVFSGIQLNDGTVDDENDRCSNFGEESSTNDFRNCAYQDSPFQRDSIFRRSITIKHNNYDNHNELLKFLSLKTCSPEKNGNSCDAREDSCPCNGVAEGQNDDTDLSIEDDSRWKAYNGIPLTIHSHHLTEEKKRSKFSRFRAKKKFSEIDSFKDDSTCAVELVKVSYPCRNNERSRQPILTCQETRLPVKKNFFHSTSCDSGKPQNVFGTLRSVGSCSVRNEFCERQPNHWSVCCDDSNESTTCSYRDKDLHQGKTKNNEFNRQDNFNEDYFYRPRRPVKSALIKNSKSELYMKKSAESSAKSLLSDYKASQALANRVKDKKSDSSLIRRNSSRSNENRKFKTALLSCPWKFFSSSLNRAKGKRFIGTSETQYLSFESANAASPRSNGACVNNPDQGYNIDSMNTNRNSYSDTLYQYHPVNFKCLSN